MNHSESQLHGLGAEFPSASALLQAAEKVRDSGFRKWDVYSPFPIHGMDAAMGFQRSRVSLFSLVGGITGLSAAFTLIYYTSALNYPLIVQGKPYFALEPSLPVFFELTILLTAFGTIIGLLLLTLMPRFHHPVFNWERFKKVSDDGFFLVLEAADPRFEKAGSRRFLEELGGSQITEIYQDPEPSPHPARPEAEGHA
ncbi:MAG: DUF3341 domain-containing protein [Verrucomicrobia bacterium]|jgi:Protein of unknown function (DUF3341)|nr:DUF3341 domain-containing protein [Verrucomicrobiota bacterium]